MRTTTPTQLFLGVLAATLINATPISNFDSHSTDNGIHRREASPQNLGRYVCPPGQPLGSLACTSETSFVICSNWAAGSIVQPVGAGTACKGDKIVPAVAFIAPVKADEPKKVNPPPEKPIQTLGQPPPDQKSVPTLGAPPPVPKPTIISGNGHVVILPIN